MRQLTNFVRYVIIMIVIMILGIEFGYIYSELNPPHFTSPKSVPWYGCLVDMNHKPMCWRAFND